MAWVGNHPVKKGYVMYIEPRTNIRLLKNVPLTEDYVNTLWFESTQAQYQYMVGLTKFNLTNYTYQRVNKGTARVGIIAENLYDCNYMMFQNTAFGNKWFYAFITSVEYVNNECSQITFVIDVMQTWFIDNVTLNECFVEREHVSDDTIGANTVEENLPIGEYVINNQQEIVTQLGVGVYVLDYEEGYYSLNGNVFTPLKNVGVTLDELTSQGSQTEFVQLINSLSDQPERVALLTMLPADMITNRREGSLIGFSRTFDVLREYDGFVFNSDKYNRVKNNKLYCYPYCLFTIDNFNGGIEQFRWEDFLTNNLVSFRWDGTPSPKPVMECYPQNYKGTGTQHPQVDTGAKQFTISYDNFPMCPYTIDSFRAWCSNVLNKQIVNTAVQTAVYIGGLATGIGAPLAIGMAGGLLTNAINTQIDYKYHKLHGQSLGGIVGEAGMNWSKGRVGFRYTYYTIKPEFARQIDEYFSMYGYQINRVKLPEVSSRPHWNYVKTRNCTLKGECPSDDIKLIQSIFNNGITFWKNGDEVGDYSLDNSISEVV